MKIVNKTRFFISLIIITLILSFFISMVTTSVFSATLETFDEITVSEGDTLWNIAIKLNGDVNKNIYEIKQINNLKESLIYPGQKLLIPSI